MTTQAGAADAEPAWVADVLRFWFEELRPEAWFRRDDAVDAEIRGRFSALVDTAHALPLNALAATARTARAAVITLDQFPRNIHRGSPRAFAYDEKAREIADVALARRHDADLDSYGRLFLYLPFEHSEDAADQVRAVQLIGALGDAELTKYAEAHKRIIDRFGRFPHRNAALGRETTPEEFAFLREPGSSF